MPGRDLIVVANRLPVHRVQRGGRAEWQISPGGLVSALTPLLQERGGTWVGWTGKAGGVVPGPFDHTGIHNVPVPLSRQEVAAYYDGFANSTLWPLYHDCIRPPVYRRDWWRVYQEVNHRFARAVSDVAGPGAAVWVQDYHLQLVPAMLRERRPDLSIGFFLHIPFPPKELFSQLPWRRSLLLGLLGADVIGLQRRHGAQNFGHLVARYAGVRSRSGYVQHEGRSVFVGEFPISIDFEKFETQAAKPETVESAEALRRRLAGRRIFLGIDRLDYTKGIDLRLRAFREMLEKRGRSSEDTVLVQTAVPSREHVKAYQSEKEHIEALVGEVNGSQAAIGRAAVHYVRRNFAFEELVGMYRAADVMLVTPLRDGMNLVAKEFVASRVDERGVLLLSEFAGAADELRSAVMVNPHDVEGLAMQMVWALDMTEAEQRRRMRAMRRVVSENTVYDWARTFLDRLEVEQ